MHNSHKTWVLETWSRFGHLVISSLNLFCSSSSDYLLRGLICSSNRNTFSMIRAPIGVLLFGIMQFILKSSASESSTSLFHYIKMKYTEIYYYFTEHKSGNRFNIHYLRTDISSPLAMCFSKCDSLFIYCCILNHCLCPYDCWCLLLQPGRTHFFPRLRVVRR